MSPARPRQGDVTSLDQQRRNPRQPSWEEGPLTTVTSAPYRRRAPPQHSIQDANNSPCVSKRAHAQRRTARTDGRPPTGAPADTAVGTDAVRYR